MLKKSALRTRKINTLLGQPYSTANNKLIKKIMFYYIDSNQEKCYRCGTSMQEDDWTIEHKFPWLYSDDPIGNFFSLDNVGYSHKNCNYDDSRKSLARGCPSISSYNKGCRCEGCLSLFERNQIKWADGAIVKMTGGRAGKQIKKSTNADERREGKKQLGKNVSTSFNQLLRDLLVNYLISDDQKCNKCFKPLTRENYKITHKDNWMEQPFPKSYFFNLKNVCFEHRNCNKVLD